MTDREQTRRYAERWTKAQNAANDHLTPTAYMARHVLALLAELEQAERERDEWKTANGDHFAALVAEKEHASAQVQSLIRQREQAEARLAKVPALVEALRQITEAHRLIHASRIARAALTVWEQE